MHDLRAIDTAAASIPPELRAQFINLVFRDGATPRVIARWQRYFSNQCCTDLGDAAGVEAA